MRPHPLSRGHLLRVLASLSASLFGEHAAIAKTGPPARPGAITLPLEREGGAFCIQYFVEGQRFRAVADTGSPFLLVDGASCLASRWGCFDETGTSTQLGDASEEGFGGQDVGVEWRRGTLRLGGPNSAKHGSPEALDFAPVNFGVVRSSVGKGGTQAIYLGLAKDRQPRIRPTLLEQTDIQSLSFDFVKKRLTLARHPLVGSDGVPLVDLRPLGAPVAPYACKVHRLIVNGHDVPLQRQCVAVLDTGTTGLVISDELYDSDELPLPGAAMRHVAVEVLTERGRVVRFGAARRPKPPPVTLASTSTASSPPVDVEEFPFIVTPVRLPWFEAQPSAGSRSAESAARRAASRALGASPHVLFLGLAFMADMRLTIDTDAQRLSAEHLVATRFDASGPSPVRMI